MKMAARFCMENTFLKDAKKKVFIAILKHLIQKNLSIDSLIAIYNFSYFTSLLSSPKWIFVSDMKAHNLFSLLGQFCLVGYS